MKTWNFGIVGTGMIADFHAQAIGSLKNARLIGFWGLNPHKTQALSKKYQCKAFSNFEELLNCDEIEILTIATPSGAHMEPAIEAAVHGKHVICEKPLEISLKRIDRMIEAHAKAGTSLGGIFNYRFNEAVNHLKEAVEEGRFGKISFASVQVPWWRSDDYYKNNWHGTWKLDGGGALMNQSIHMIDLLQYLMGPVSSLHAYAATIGHSIEVEDTATAILRFKNGALGSIYGSTTSFPGQFRSLTITGTEGTAVMVENSFKVWQFANQTESDIEIQKRLGEIKGGGGISDPSAISFQSHAKFFEAFIKSIETGIPFEINGTEARKAVEIVLAIYQSAREDKPYTFPGTGSTAIIKKT